jgi:hypothetical protein
MAQGFSSQSASWFRYRAKARVTVVVAVEEMAVGQVFLGILRCSLSVFFHNDP